MTSYGASLPDSVPSLLDPRLSSHLSLLPALSQFLSQLTTLQRDSSLKASQLCGTFRRHLSSTASERSGGGGLEQTSTLELGLARWAEQLDLGLRGVGECAGRVEREVREEAEKVGGRLAGVHKKHHAHYKSLLSLRDSAYSTRDRSRSTYFSSCESLESARQKRASAQEKGGSGADKAQRVYDAAYEEMERAKNQYLLDLDTANYAKSILYDTYLPHVEDEYQELEKSAVKQLVGLLGRMCELQRESQEKVRESVEEAAQAVGSVEVERDQEEWVRRLEPSVLGAFEKPGDLVFEESPVWHDTDAFSTSPSSVIYLQNVKQKAAVRAQEMLPEIDAKKREVGGLKNLRESYQAQPGLGDTVGVIQNLYTTSHALSTLEFTSSLLRAEMDLIDATLGDSASSAGRPHDFKPHSFVTPSTCAVCEGSVWGKGMQCRACSMAVHGKCELKVPAGCAARPGAGIVRVKSKKHGAAASTPSSSANSPSPLSPTSSSTSSFTPLSTTTLPPPRRTVPPAHSSSDSLPPMHSAQSPSPAVEGTGQRAVVQYDHDAQSGFELSVRENDPVLVLVPEDESGWVKVRDERDGREGLVPGSYLEIGSTGAAGGAGAGGAAAGGGGGRVVALYDYAAQAADELSLREGEEAELTAVGMGVGEGWAEITKNGQIGIVPSSYVQVL